MNIFIKINYFIYFIYFLIGLLLIKFKLHNKLINNIYSYSNSINKKITLSERLIYNINEYHNNIYTMHDNYNNINFDISKQLINFINNISTTIINSNENYFSDLILERYKNFFEDIYIENEPIILQLIFTLNKNNQMYRVDKNYKNNELMYILILFSEMYFEIINKCNVFTNNKTALGYDNNLLKIHMYNMFYFLFFNYILNEFFLLFNKYFNNAKEVIYLDLQDVKKMLILDLFIIKLQNFFLYNNRISVKLSDLDSEEFMSNMINFFRKNQNFDIFGNSIYIDEWLLFFDQINKDIVNQNIDLYENLESIIYNIEDQLNIDIINLIKEYLIEKDILLNILKIRKFTKIIRRKYFMLLDRNKIISNKKNLDNFIIIKFNDIKDIIDECKTIDINLKVFNFIKNINNHKI